MCCPFGVCVCIGVFSYCLIAACIDSFVSVCLLLWCVNIGVFVRFCLLLLLRCLFGIVFVFCCIVLCLVDVVVLWFVVGVFFLLV